MAQYTLLALSPVRNPIQPPYEWRPYVACSYLRYFTNHAACIFKADQTFNTQIGQVKLLISIRNAKTVMAAFNGAYIAMQ